MRMGRKAWPQESLQPSHGSAGNIAAHQVGIPPLQLGWASGVGSQDGIPKTGGKAFDLRSNQLGYLTRIALRIAARDVRISPQREPPGRVGHVLLACQY